MREIKVYDDSRKPPDWNALLSTGECAVFLKQAASHVPLTPDGSATGYKDAVVLLFDSLVEARDYCQAKVLEHPEMCCDVFDSAGRAKPPLLIIAHPRVLQKDGYSSRSTRRRNLLAATLLLLAPVCFWWDWRSQWTLVLPTLLGINMILGVGRILWWNASRKDHLRDHTQRIS